MRNLAAIFLVVLCVLAFPAEAQQRREGIVAVVNNEAITNSDVKARLDLVLSSSGMPPTQDLVAKLRPQVVNALIEETIKNQEAKRLNLSVDAADIDQAVDNIAAQNKMSGADFRTMLKKRGVPIASLKDQIRSQILWVKVIGKQIKPKVDINEQDIDAELAAIGAKIGQTELLLSEIVLPVDRPQDEANIRVLADRLAEQVKKSPQDFPKLAQQFSKSAGAAQGGDLGWMSATQFPAELEKPLVKAAKGDIIGPVKAVDGFHILMVREQRTRAKESLPDRAAVTNRIGLERLDRLQRRYFLDLKSSAYIETRV